MICIDPRGPFESIERAPPISVAAAADVDAGSLAAIICVQEPVGPLPTVADMDERAHRLIDRIYAAALNPDLWLQVTEGVSEIFGGSPVLLGFVLPDETAGTRFAVGIDEPYCNSHFEHLFKDVPWSNRFTYHFKDHWGHMGEVLGHVDLATTGLYTEWLEPQGLAAAWTVGHTICNEKGEVRGGFSVFPRAGAPPYTPDQFAEADALVPHLRRAIEIYQTVHGAQRVRLALAEAIDRLPTGVLLLDSKRRVVVQNQGAERILAAEDGFRIDRHGPSADVARENATLQRLIADAMETRAGREIRTAGFVAISRPSGQRSYAVMVTPLLAAPRSAMSDAVVAIFVADPNARFFAGPEALTELYQLTHSEAELVRLLAAGLSLEEAADKRGVSLNTARSHLKHVFAKTDTSRQGELVRLIVSGVGQIREL
jgi:DNA-binding CsgD family transcriptional regulator/PAS domain-containing protein